MTEFQLAELAGFSFKRSCVGCRSILMSNGERVRTRDALYLLDALKGVVYNTETGELTNTKDLPEALFNTIVKNLEK